MLLYNYCNVYHAYILQTTDALIAKQINICLSLQQFSIDLGSNTIEVTDPYLAISALDVGQRIGFSWLDEVAMNQYYNCEKDCTMDCKNGGYVRKLPSGVCQCFCPPGLSMCTTIWKY